MNGIERQKRQSRGFSLAEMMIALVILGFGLLIIGAALPVGLTYSRDSADISTGEAATEYAAGVVSNCVRLKRSESGVAGAPRWDDVFRPRTDPGADGIYFNGDDVFAVNDRYEPLIKVRPLLAEFINATPGANWSSTRVLNNPANPQSPLFIDENIEQQVRRWVGNNGVLDSFPAEYDLLRRSPTMSAMSLVYPGVINTGLHSVISYSSSDAPSNFPPRSLSAGEARKAINRSIVTSVFYRRVAYDRYVDQGGTTVVQPADAGLYELIVVAIRLATPAHRFPLYNVATTPYTYSGRDGHVPQPLLLTFNDLYPTGLINDIPPAPGFTPNLDRLIDPTWVGPPTLTFIAPQLMGEMLPPGSVFIPAVNDDFSTALRLDDGPFAPPALPDVFSPLLYRQAGFIPHAPSTPPLYTVQKRNPLSNGDYEIVVKNEGFYPWTNPVNSPGLFPVWVIPPAFKELSGGRPVFEDKSPIVAVNRRIVRLREIP